MTPQGPAVNSIAFDPANGDTIYVAQGSFIDNNESTLAKRHIYKTTNASTGRRDNTY